MTWLWLIPIAIAAVLAYAVYTAPVVPDDFDDIDWYSDGEGIGRDDGEGRS
jgi:hypothetical protein